MNTFAQNLPSTPGVYKMKDTEGNIIYIGKAKNLKSRVSSYFQNSANHSMRTKKMVQAIADIEIIETDTELEALVLEATFINEVRPKYNVLLKDDKSYVYIKVDTTVDFPRIHVVRERDMPPLSLRKGARYFGPKLSGTKVYETLRLLKKLFPHKHCQLTISFLGDKKEADLYKDLLTKPNKDLVEVKNRVIDFPCLDYFIKRCPGPCIGAVSPVEYKKIVHQIIDFLSGKTEELEESLKQQMREAAESKQFERAAAFRDKLRSVESMSERQKISDPHRKDTDVINFITDVGRIYFNVFMIRGGKIVDQENFIMDALDARAVDGSPPDAPEILESFLIQYYKRVAEMPNEILVPIEIDSAKTLGKWLHTSITHPERGDKNKLLELSHKNALTFAKQHRIKWMAQEQKEQALARLAQAVGLGETALNRIEGFDISHLGGSETVGSMVVFTKGVPDSGQYRHFTIRTVTGKPDDYRCMEEVLMRRLKYIAKPMGYSVRAAGKKSLKNMKEWGNTAEWPELLETTETKDFYMLIKDKKEIGMARMIELEPGIFEISALYISPEHRGNKLSYVFMEKMIGKIKNKKARIYVQVEKELMEHYLEFGFVEINDAPESVVSRKKELEKLDSKAYHILAYYRAKKKTADPSFSAKPNLLLIDGGKGQLKAALNVLKKLNLNIPVISLAKRLEEIYIPGAKAPLLLEEGEEALKLLQRIRDESHRFAITFQRNLHRKAIFND